MDVAHEALIRGWPRLGQWINEDRAGLRLHRRLSEAATEWQREHRSEDFLYRGARLAQAVEWREPNETSLNELERAFLDASLAREKRAEEEEKERQRRELEAAQRLAKTEKQRAEAERQRAEEQRKAATRFQRLSTALVGLFFMALIGAGFAYYAKRDAEAQRRIAVEQQQKSEEKEQTALQLNYVANINLAQAAFASRNYRSGYQALNEFLPVSGTPATEDRRGFEWYYLWRLNHQELATLQGHTGAVRSVAFAADGRTLASGGWDGTMRLWIGATDEEVAAQRGD